MSTKATLYSSNSGFKQLITQALHDFIKSVIKKLSNQATELSTQEAEHSNNSALDPHSTRTTEKSSNSTLKQLSAQATISSTNYKYDLKHSGLVLSQVCVFEGSKQPKLAQNGIFGHFGPSKKQI